MSVGYPITGAARFLLTFSPGTRVTLQYDDRLQTTGIFQGFQDGAMLLTGFNGIPGVVRITINRSDAVSVG